ncbi:MAG: Piwi domain-containing protein [Thermosphaera sp.]
MSESLFLNVFRSSSIALSNFKVWRLPTAITGMRELYAIFKQLSQNKIADCVLYKDSVYFKGDPRGVRESLSRLPGTYIGSELNETILSPLAESSLIKVLLYSAFERELENKNWRVLSRRKKALPPPTEKNEEFYLELTDENIVLFGLKYMFEIRPNNDVLLWLDIYAPIWSIANKRRLTRSEISEKLKRDYVNRALLRTKERFQKLLKILDILFPEKMITLEFCDETSISFLKKNYEVPSIQEGYVGSELFQWAPLDEPFLRFKHGYSRNPRRIIDQSAYSYGAIKEIPVKAVVARSLKEDFINLYRKIDEGFSGKYMFWPGFSKVTGAEILFNEKNDIVEVESDDETNVLHGLIEVSNGAKENAVVFIVLPNISSKTYYAIKTEALRRKICTQIILKDTLSKEPLEFTIMNIAVALYAKAGGTPWVLKDPLTIKRGLFIGIAFHLDHTAKDIYYGVMEVFNRYGVHLVCKTRMYKYPGEIKSVRGLFIPRKEAEEILESLVKEYEPREIIFHKSAPFHKEEKEAIEYICNKHNIDYYLVHIEGANPYRVCAPQLDYTPLRGTIVFDSVNNNRAILTTTGQTIMEYGKIKPWSSIGTPRPLEVIIEEKRGEGENIREICEQVLALTKLNWNTTEISIRLPITLKYPRKAARLTRHFEGIREGLIDIADFRYLI